MPRSPDVGVHDVTCRECGVAGQIRVTSVKGANARVEDAVTHLEVCSRYVRPQPRHLKDRLSWRRQEKRANALVGARATLASGAVNMDGDGRVLREWRVESKQTKYEYFVLTQAVWGKLVEGARGFGEEPLLHINLKARNQNRVVIAEVLYAALTDVPPLPPDEEQRKRKTTYRVDSDLPTPSLVPLDPPGVLLFEEEFLELKKALP